jgi:mannose-6-phosphate isomerase-like protein (cupin superfamily)
MQIRRVVTGQQTDGKSVFVIDEVVEPITTQLMPGTEFHNVWSTDTPVKLPTDGTPPGSHGYFPPSSGFRFGYFTLGPSTVTTPEDLDIGAAFSELQEKLPGMTDVLERENPGMHTTDTIDYDIVISGEVWLELDDGQEVRLEPGDCVVQNGTRHAWHNRSDQPVTLAVVLIGAIRDSTTP